MDGRRTADSSDGSERWRADGDWENGRRAEGGGQAGRTAASSGGQTGVTSAVRRPVRKTREAEDIEEDWSLTGAVSGTVTAVSFRTCEY